MDHEAVQFSNMDLFMCKKSLPSVGCFVSTFIHLAMPRCHMLQVWSWGGGGRTSFIPILCMTKVIQLSFNLIKELFMI